MVMWVVDFLNWELTGTDDEVRIFRFFGVPPARSRVPEQWEIQNG